MCSGSAMPIPSSVEIAMPGVISSISPSGIHSRVEQI
jgi:hypothetical protein